MDRPRIDDVLRSLSATAADRRTLGRGLAAAATAGIAARLGLDEADARKKKKRKKRCPNGGRRCGRRCTDTSIDPNHCGACGRECGEGETCSDGFCVVVNDFPEIPNALPGARNIAVAAEGNLVVVDLVRDRLLRFLSQTDDVFTFGVSGAANGQFAGPAGVAARGQTIFVADTGNHRIQRLDIGLDTGIMRHELSFGSRGNGRDQFNNPGAVAVDPGGDVIYVADTSNNRIKVHNVNGTALDQFGSPGAGNGQFNLPVGVAVRNLGGNDRALYVADLSNNRIQVFDGEQRFVTAFGRRGSGDGEFLGPRGVAVAPDGTVFVSDGGNDRVQQFSADGAFLRAFGSEGSAPGELRSPEGLAVGPDGTIHVCDAGNERIQSFKPAKGVAAESGRSDANPDRPGGSRDAHPRRKPSA